MTKAYKDNLCPNFPINLGNETRNQKKWIAALRSGEFKQTYGQLEIQGEYCALGVLSVLALLEGVCTYDSIGDGGRFDNRRTTLSYNVMSWAGIKDFLEDPQAYWKTNQRIYLVCSKSIMQELFGDLPRLNKFIALKKQCYFQAPHVKSLDSFRQTLTRTEERSFVDYELKKFLDKSGRRTLIQLATTRFRTAA